ncbi:MAG: transposase [Chitinophagaceae bacterium]|nr:transposase [Chitinophagaceae bacterium]
MMVKAERYLFFLQKNFHLKATEVAQLYKHRWKIELFFKCLPQRQGLNSI